MDITQFINNLLLFCLFNVFYNYGASYAQPFLPRNASAERGNEIACRLSVCNVQVP